MIVSRSTRFLSSLAIALGAAGIAPAPLAAHPAARGTTAGTLTAIPDTSAHTADSARASALVRDIRAALHTSDLQTGVATAEQRLTQLDAIPGVLPQKITGHRILQGYYGNFDIDDKRRANAQAILTLAKQLPTSIQPRAVHIVSGAYSDLASLQANDLHPDSALATLKAAPAAFPAIPDLLAELAPDIARYQLIGQKAPALQGDYWLNRSAGASSPSPIAWGDSVSVLVFTANWCHSCKDSYPTLTELASKDASRGLRIVLAIMLDGQFGGVQMAPAQEVEANQEYYVTHHGFHCPIALQRPSAEPSAAGDTAAATKGGANDAANAVVPPRNSDAFLLTGLPQFIVIDRTGTIRAVLTGWDPSGRRQHALTAIVTKLLGA